MLHGLPVLEAEDLEPDAPGGEIVLGVAEDEIAILEGADDVHARICRRQALEQGREPLAALPGLRVVLNVFRLVDHGDRVRVSGFDAFEQGADFIFVRCRHFSLRVRCGEDKRLHSARFVKTRDLVPPCHPGLVPGSRTVPPQGDWTPE